jgi:hypothetical protein
MSFTPASAPVDDVFDTHFVIGPNGSGCPIIGGAGIINAC